MHQPASSTPPSHSPEGKLAAAHFLYARLHPNGGFLEANPLLLEFLGYPPDTPPHGLPAAVAMLFDACDWKAVAMRVLRGKPWQGALKCRNRYGEPKVWTGIISPLESPSAGYVAWGQDATQDHQLRRQLEALSDHQERWLTDQQSLHEKLYQQQERHEHQLREIRALNMLLMKSEEAFRQMALTGKLGGWEMQLEAGYFRWTTPVPSTLHWPYPKQKLELREVLRNFMPEHRNNVLQAFRSIAQHKTDRFDLEARLAMPDGSWVRITGEVTPEEPNKVSGLIQDISQQHQAKGQLEEAYAQLTEVLAQEREMRQQMEEVLGKLRQTQSKLLQAEKLASIGQLAAGIAHEINNPLNYIAVGMGVVKELVAGMAECLRALPPNTPPEQLGPAFSRLRAELHLDDALETALPIIETIDEGISRTTEIVKGLRIFSRGDSEKKAMFNLHKGLDATLMLLGHEARHRIEVVRRYDPQLPLVECYPGQINQVFMNLLMNAMQAIPQQGRIEIKTQDLDDGTVAISISDSGTGIPPHIIPRIFEPFFTTKAVGTGTGLGLSISYNIMEQHRGQLRCSSELGKGSTFTAILPVLMPA